MTEAPGSRRPDPAKIALWVFVVLEAMGIGFVLWTF